MKTIRCRNKFKGRKNGTCGHIIAIMTDLQVEMFKIDPEEGMILRCPGCPKEQRWIRLSDKGKGLMFEVIEYNEKVPPEPVYRDELVYSQVG